MQAQQRRRLRVHGPSPSPLPSQQQAATTGFLSSCPTPTPSHPAIGRGSVELIGALQVGQRLLVLAKLLVRLGAADERLEEVGLAFQGGGALGHSLLEAAEVRGTKDGDANV